MRGHAAPAPSGSTARELAARFAHTLIPIAAAYLVAHYFSLLAYNGQDLWRLASDPLGDGSDLFGGAERGDRLLRRVARPAIWYVQVGALVVGHVAALVLAHDRALVSTARPKAATRSQIVMLVLMVVLHLPRPLAAVGGAERIDVLVFAHAGHWLVQLLYLVPLAVLVGVILAGRRARPPRGGARAGA